jgi:hypothetical protein
MGIMNKYMKGERKDPRSRGANRVRNPRDGQSNNKIDDRFSHYGRNDDPQHGSSPRHRRDGRGDGRDRQSTSTRDNGRDHHRSSRRRSRSRSRSYDSRSRSRSPDYRRRRRSRSRSDSRDRHHSSSSRRHNRSSRDHARTSSSHRDQNNIPPTFGQNPPGSMAHHNMVPPPPPPPQRPQNMMQQTMTMGQQQQLLTPQMMVHGGLQRPMQPQQPQQFVQSIGQIPQLGQGTTDAQLQPFLQQYQQQLLQQQFQQSVPGSSMPQPSLQQLQQLQNYTQNMQQLNQAGKMMSGSHVAGLTNMILGQQQQGSGSQPPGNANNNLYSSVQNQNPDQQPLLDIFGLADKAAQALSAGRLPQVNPTAASVGTMSNPNFPPMLNASNLSAPTYQPHQQQSNTPSRQHNTATESDLPVMVKYAIQVSALLSSHCSYLYALARILT